MRKVGRRLDRGKEPLGTHLGGQLGLQRDLALVLEVVGQLDAAFAKFTLDRVAAF